MMLQVRTYRFIPKRLTHPKHRKGPIDRLCVERSRVEATRIPCDSVAEILILVVWLLAS